MFVTDVARQLGATPTTVRRWSNEFAEILHAPARGGNHAVRRFDNYDLQVLSRAAELLRRTGATYARVKELLLDEFIGPIAAPSPPAAIKILPGVAAPAQTGETGSAAEQGEQTPPLEELVAVAVTAATRGHALQITGLTETVEALGHSVRDLKTRVVALEDIALSKRARWPFRS